MAIIGNIPYFQTNPFKDIPNSDSVGFESLGPESGATKMHALKNRNGLGTLLEPCWNLFRTLLEPLWNLARTLLESFWNLAGTLLEPLWNLAGTLPEPCCNSWLYIGKLLWRIVLVLIVSGLFYLFVFLASFQCFLALLCVLVLSGNGGAGRTPTDEDLLLGTCCWHLFLAGV